jgi:hypothetical protein
MDRVSYPEIKLEVAYFGKAGQSGLTSWGDRSERYFPATEHEARRRLKL